MQLISVPSIVVVMCAISLEHSIKTSRKAIIIILALYMCNAIWYVSIDLLYFQ